MIEVINPTVVSPDRGYKIQYEQVDAKLAKLRGVSAALSELYFVTDKFDKSEGKSKNALCDEMENLINAGLTLQKAIDSLVDGIENGKNIFMKTDMELAAMIKNNEC